MEFGKRGNRLGPHQKWLHELISAGYTPADFTVIVAQGLTKKEAHAAERSLLKTLDPTRLFNGHMGVHGLKMTAEKVALGRALRAQGKTWVEAAQIIGVNKQTLWRALTNRTEGLRHV